MPADVVLRAAATGEWRRERTDDPADGAVPFRDARSTTFAEATWLASRGPLQWLVGGAFRRDAYANLDIQALDLTDVTPALMAHGTWTASPWLALSASERLDASRRAGTIGSPRVSLLLHAAHALEARLSAGTGFAAPTAFTDETQAIRLARLVPPAHLAAERIRGASLDLTGRRGPVELNGTLYASEIRRAVLLDEEPAGAPGMVALENAPGPTRTRGAELFAVLSREPLAVTAYESRLEATEVDPATGLRRDVPLTARNAAGVDVAWDEDDTGTRVGLEAFHTGPQSLEHDPLRTRSEPYWTVGVLVSQRVGRALLYVNGDDLGDVRQTRWEPLLLPAPGPGGRVTTDAWAPLEGRTFNAGVRWSF